MVVRGGMAALLHTGPSLQRISEDIDVMTTASKDQIISIINTLNEDSRELDISIEEGRTRLPERLIHCQTRCSSSSILKHCTAKVDILCGIDPSLLQYVMKMRSPRLETLVLKHDVDVLSRGALIADKMCTLTSTETIGLRGLKNFPKQIHDIAMLLKTTNMDDLQTLFRAYAHFATFMLHLHHQTCSTRDLIDSTHERCKLLFDFREDVLLSPEYQKFYTRFQSRYVKNRRVHTEFHHVDEILLTLLCARHLREYDTDADLEGHSRELHETIHKYAQAKKRGESPESNSVVLARIGKEHPNLAGPHTPLTPAQWMLLLEAFAPLLA
ncbi:MAG: nucleotidyl transferase AbiEii/AbiGii toxin family protein [Thaumarchaeota archaeon]|nr:nucleotidyl transferase AbiEii/AbiGii toxin family protein [Nitrososphaerota archaeon]